MFRIQEPLLTSTIGRQWMSKISATRSDSAQAGSNSGKQTQEPSVPRNTYTCAHTRRSDTKSLGVCSINKHPGSRWGACAAGQEYSACETERGGREPEQTCSCDRNADSRHLNANIVAHSCDWSARVFFFIKDAGISQSTQRHWRFVVTSDPPTYLAYLWSFSTSLELL